MVTKRREQHHAALATTFTGNHFCFVPHGVDWLGFIDDQWLGLLSFSSAI